MPARPKTVLCIDDEPQTLVLRRNLLEMYGFSVVTELSGADGLRRLAEGPVDLVLLDYMMPGMTGEQLAEEIKRLHPSMPVVVVSGFPELPEGLLRKVDGYVRKGQDPEAMIVVVNSALASRHP